MAHFDGGTKGKSSKECPSHTQETNIIQVNYDGKQKSEDFLFPKAQKRTVSAGEKAVSGFPVKY